MTIRVLLFTGIAVLLIAATAAVAADGLSISGTISDAQNAVVPGASVTLLSALQDIVAVARSDSAGRFILPRVAPGSYILLVKSAGFAERRVPVRLTATPASGLSIRLEVHSPGDLVTITANLGAAETVASAPQPVNVIERGQISARSTAVLAQAVAEEVGLHLQRTSPTIAGIFVRGLTGNKINVYVDGVRYTTASQRGGISTFFDLVEPSAVEAIEVLRGPSSAQYGSDAIGGSVQLVTRLPSFSPDGKPAFRGSVETRYSSADSSFGTSTSGSYAGANLGVFVNLAGRRVNTLRPGQGLDSHAAVTRFLGLRSDILGNNRLPDTAFTQYAGTTRLHWAPDPQSQVVGFYGRSQQDGGKRYDQLLGGDGNLVADLRNLMLDFGYLRYDRFRMGWLDQAAAVYSFNSQREERVNQGGNGNPRSSVNHEYERTSVHGLQFFGRKQLGQHSVLAGADYYHEGAVAPSFAINPVTGLSTLRRGRIPHGAHYQSGGAYVEDSFQAIPDRLRLIGNLRYSVASYRARSADSPNVNGKSLWPNDSLRVSDFTFRASAVLTLVSGLNTFSGISRGFRAPGVTDLGTFGLTGSGYEVSAPEVAGKGATVGTTADSTARSSGRAVRQVEPESSLTCEGGIRYRRTGLFVQFSVFVNDIMDSIEKLALILPAGAVGKTLAEQPIVAQTADGVVFVPASTAPVLVRTNYGDARIKGIEHSFEWRLNSEWATGTIFTWVRAKNRANGLPPTIEGGTPAPDGYFRLRYSPGGGSFWIEPVVHAAARQNHLSTLDLEDRRTGAGRSRTSIRSFFYSGAAVRGLVGPGPDGVSGNADDRLLATGETLAQVQDRILGVGVSSAPMFNAIPGYVTFDVRCGFRISERHDFLVQLHNLGDRNYRGISWGMDAPGRGLTIVYRSRF